MGYLTEHAWKALLLRVGIDKGTGGALGPIFEDDTFEYIPIPEKSSNTKENRTYKDLFDRYGNSLSTYLPEVIGNKVIHFDPEFETFTYGDPTSKRNALLQFKKDDLLVFYAGLTQYKKNDEYKKGLYIIGYFTVEKVIDFCKLTDENVERCFQRYPNNAHLKRSYESKQEMREITGERLGLVMVVGDKKGSEILKKAILISEPRKDKKERTYQAVSKEMEALLGIQGSIQKSVPPRFIREEKNLSNLKDKLGV
ncbi:hypothetical protein C5S31_05640 [ANME-1 cluster archaeon GoMg2]|nr:hypothetical protein [ANME-1 cluster archaeon GoMg2]